jgi:hypothetical protein
MGLLIVEAQGTAATGAASGIAAVGNSHPLYLFVSVTDADGVPVNGLAAAPFTIKARIVAPGARRSRSPRRVEASTATTYWRLSR